MTTEFHKLTTQQILQNKEHRGWELPKGNWSFYQEWHNTVFIHWKADIEEVRKYVPPQLEIDLFEGQAWVSLIVFGIRHMRPRYMPSISPFSNLDEINIRTYIKYKGKPGIFFFSLEASNWLSCRLANTFADLPYRQSIIRSSGSSYSSYNQKQGDTMHLSFDVKEKKKATSPFDRWLTDRYVFFQKGPKGQINEMEIHHYQWPLYEIELKNCFVRYNRYRSLIHDQPQLAHFSPGVQVLAWGLKKHPPG